jgi:hypothetical protein
MLLLLELAVRSSVASVHVVPEPLLARLEPRKVEPAAVPRTVMVVPVPIAPTQYARS